MLYTLSYILSSKPVTLWISPQYTTEVIMFWNDNDFIFIFGWAQFNNKCFFNNCIAFKWISIHFLTLLDYERVNKMGAWTARWRVCVITWYSKESSHKHKPARGCLTIKRLSCVFYLYRYSTKRLYYNTTERLIAATRVFRTTRARETEMLLSRMIAANVHTFISNVH